ncbi:MAG: ABC transporter substrate-binding protein, partial [Pseudomonadota bacterium]
MQFGKYGLIISLWAVLAGPVQAAGKSDASRIVSIGGSVTEIIYMLGAADKIVAVDTTSVFPEEALQSKASVGYMRQISPEGVLSTRPDLVVAIEGAGPPQALEVLRESGIAYEKIPNTPNTDGVVEKINRIAGLLGRQAQANEAI